MKSDALVGWPVWLHRRPSIRGRNVDLVEHRSPRSNSPGPLGPLFEVRVIWLASVALSSAVDVRCGQVSLVACRSRAGWKSCRYGITTGDTQRRLWSPTSPPTPTATDVADVDVLRGRARRAPEQTCSAPVYRTVACAAFVSASRRKRWNARPGPVPHREVRVGATVKCVVIRLESLRRMRCASSLRAAVACRQSAT